MNKPAGQAKTRPKKRPPRKPFVERDDGKNAQRLAAAMSAMLTLPTDVASRIRLQRHKAK